MSKAESADGKSCRFRSMTAIRRRGRWSRHAGLLVFNSFGTAPNAAIQAYLNEHGVLLFPLSGDSAPVGAALRASLP
jgi:hypothetical protein